MHGSPGRVSPRATRSMQRINKRIFSIYDFFAEGKKASIDGLKWSDLVVVGW